MRNEKNSWKVVDKSRFFLFHLECWWSHQKVELFRRSATVYLEERPNLVIAVCSIVKDKSQREYYFHQQRPLNIALQFSMLNVDIHRLIDLGRCCWAWIWFLWHRVVLRTTKKKTIRFLFVQRNSFEWKDTIFIFRVDIKSISTFDDREIHKNCVRSHDSVGTNFFAIEFR